MKKILTVVLLAFSFTVAAGQITLILSDSEVNGNTKYCYYSNANQDEVIAIPKSRQCPYTKTSSTEDDDE
ncbi:Hypothetical protein MEKHABCG_00086 [Escherichia phage vB_EcoM_UP17]|nr:Hypothetical protein MEKHABCG_00086 [Escherichia phage vB_EcoM_UP17]